LASVAAVTRPTWPTPITATFMLASPLPVKK
jgi:hypothetical protein